jgi:hypothetical protein
LTIHKLETQMPLVSNVVPVNDQMLNISCCEDFWQALNRIQNLKYLLIETTFLNCNVAGAQRSGHMTAELLAQGLRLLQCPVQLFIVHMEAGRENDTMHEVLQAAGEFSPQMLQRGRVFEF